MNISEYLQSLMKMKLETLQFIHYLNTDYVQVKCFSKISFRTKCCLTQEIIHNLHINGSCIKSILTTCSSYMSKRKRNLILHKILIALCPFFEKRGFHDLVVRHQKVSLYFYPLQFKEYSLLRVILHCNRHQFPKIPTCTMKTIQ